MDLFIPEFFHSSAGLSEKIREVPETMLIKNQPLHSKQMISPDQTLIKWGRGGIACPILLPICVFPLGSKSLRKDHTRIYCSFCLLLSSRIQTPARVCAVRGLSLSLGGFRRSQVCFAQSLAPWTVSQFSRRVSSRCEGRKVFKFYWGNKGGATGAGGWGEIPSYGKLEIAQAFRRGV